MANVVKLKRGSGSDPTASDMVVGEPVIRTDTAELFFKKDDGSVAKVSGGGGGPDFKYLELRNAANNGAASYPGNDFTLVSAGTTTAVSPAAANTLLLSVSGVIQKPNSGTSTSGITGFIVDGSRLKWATNIPAAPDFILYQESGGIGEPSDETVSEEKLKVSNSPVNGYFLSAQSGNTGGLTWAAPVATSCTGNSATATALATARTINGTSFDGTANITVTAAASTLSGNTLNSSVVTSSLTSLGDLGGLTVNGDMVLTGANYNVLWDKSDNALEFADNAELRFGAGDDFVFEHNGTRNIIKTMNGEINIRYSGQDMIVAKPSGAVELYHNNSKKFETTSAGINVSGNIRVPDNENIMVGTHDDLQIIHTPNNSFIKNTTGGFYIQGGTQNNSIYIRPKEGEDSIKANSNGSVELYYDNSKVLQTHDASGYSGIDVLGDEGGHAVINLKADEGDDGADCWQWTAQTNGASYIKNLSNGSTYEYNVKMIGGGAVELYYDGTKKFETTSSGVSFANGADATTSKLLLALGNSSSKEATIQGISDSTNEKGIEFKTYSFAAKTPLTLTHDGHLKVPDNSKLKLGTGDDLQIYHDGTRSYIQDNVSNDLRIACGHIRFRNGADGATSFDVDADGATTLYHNGSTKFSTYSAGCLFTGNLKNTNDGADQAIYLGASDDLGFYHDGSDSYIENATGNLNLRVASGENGIRITPNGSVNLYYNNNQKLNTANGGVEVTGDLSLTADDPTLTFVDTNNNNFRITANTGVLYFADATANQTRATMTAGGTWTFSGSLLPGSNNTYDLGSTSKRWANVYTNDLNLSNEGGSNDVDGTWGSFTIQEGSEDLFLINKRNGKKYKFNLTEVS